MAVCAIAGTVALSYGAGASSDNPTAMVANHRRPSLSDYIGAFLHAWSVQQVTCTGPAGHQSCQVLFTNAYGSWSATLVVKGHDVVSDPAGNANWLCTAACTPLPTTTGLPQTPLGAGNGITIHDQNQGVVRTGTTAPRPHGTGSTGANGTGTSTGASTPTTPTYTPTTPGVCTPTTPGTYTPTTPGTYTPTTPGVCAPTTPGTYTPAPYTPAPYTPAPYTPTTYTPAPYTPTTYTPAPYTPAPYTPTTYTPPPYTPTTPRTH